MNSYPYGHWGDIQTACTYATAFITKYQNEFLVPSLTVLTFIKKYQEWIAKS